MGYYRENMADDRLLIVATGIFDNQATIDAVECSEPWSSHRLDDSVAIPLGERAAMLCYRADTDRGAVVYRAASSSVYRRHDDRSMPVVHQQIALQ